MERSSLHRSVEGDSPSPTEKEIERIRLLVRCGWTMDNFAPKYATHNGESLTVNGAKWSTVWDAVFGQKTVSGS